MALSGNTNKKTPTITIGTINVNSIKKKSYDIKNYINENNISILCLQEVRCMDYTICQNIEASCNVTLFVNTVTGKKVPNFYSGTAILVKKQITDQYEIYHEIIIPNRIQKIKIKENHGYLNIYNIYLQSGSYNESTRIRQLEILEQKN